MRKSAGSNEAISKEIALLKRNSHQFKWFQISSSEPGFVCDCTGTLFNKCTNSSTKACSQHIDELLGNPIEAEKIEEFKKTVLDFFKSKVPSNAVFSIKLGVMPDKSGPMVYFLFELEDAGFWSEHEILGIKIAISTVCKELCEEGKNLMDVKELDESCDWSDFESVTNPQNTPSVADDQMAWGRKVGNLRCVPEEPSSDDILEELRRTHPGIFRQIDEAVIMKTIGEQHDLYLQGKLESDLISTMVVSILESLPGHVPEQSPCDMILADLKRGRPDLFDQHSEAYIKEVIEQQIGLCLQGDFGPDLVSIIAVSILESPAGQVDSSSALMWSTPSEKNPHIVEIVQRMRIRREDDQELAYQAVI